MPISNPSAFTSFNVASLQTDRPICFPGGRLTLSATNPVADGSGVSTFYYLPYAHGVVPFWNHKLQLWEYRPIPENGISITRPTDNPRIVDVYAQAYENLPNEFGIDLQTWQSDTTRLRPLVRKHGIHAIDFTSGVSPLRTYLGSIRFVGATGSATMTDTVTQRFVFNAYNQVSKRLIRHEPQPYWTYNNTAWRPQNNNLSNRVEVLDGTGQGILDLTYSARSAVPSGCYGQYGMGVDSLTLTDGYFVNTGDNAVASRLCRTVGVGSHYVQALESAVNGTATFYSGNAHGLQGTWQC